MRKPVCLLLLLTVLRFFPVAAQSQPVDSAHFFTEEKVVAIQLSSDLKKLMVSKAQKDRQPAMVTCRFPDSTVITEPINVYARGIFRRQNCYMPSLMLDFKNKTSPLLRGLHSLKLVGGCRVGKDYEQLLLKEYIIYKIYNLLTDKSFRVRLVYMTYDDTQKKVKSYSQYGFLLENMDELTRRNHCRELKKVKVPTQATDRKQMTLVDIFQYMIGNTDWSVPVYHNIRLMQPEDDSAARPYVIPYDFDFSGLVNAEYAAPAPELGTESVTERVYRGFPRSMQEIQETLDLFRQKKDSIYALINHFDLLWEGTRREMTGYLDDFYSTINNKDQVQQVFIDNARLR